MTDETVEQQGDSKRRREHPEVPQAADRTAAAVKAQPTLKLGSVVVCTILCVNFEAAKRKRVTVKPVAVFAEGRREGGPVVMTLRNGISTKPIAEPDAEN